MIGQSESLPIRIPTCGLAVLEFFIGCINVRRYKEKGGNTTSTSGQWNLRRILQNASRALQSQAARFNCVGRRVRAER